MEIKLHLFIKVNFSSPSKGVHGSVDVIGRVGIIMN